MKEQNSSNTNREFLDKFSEKYDPILKALAGGPDEEIDISELKKQCATAESKANK